MNTDMLKKAKEIQDWVVRYRRDFHKHPEQSFKEFRTSKIVSEELIKMGIKVEHIGETGVVGILKGACNGKVIALRADMDALSVTEDTGLPFTSENIGFMHACGHDCHTSMLLGAAKLLSEIKEQLNGTVKFIFQPAEEVAAGAKKLVEGGVLKNPDVDFIFGMHIWSDIPVGKVVLKEGPFMASGDIWDLTIKGKSCHGSSPWQGVDAIVCASAVINGIQSIVSRINDVRSPIVINIGTIHGGERFNVTPGSVKMEGMNRAFNSYTRKKIPEWVEKIVKSTCKAYGCDYEYNYNFICATTTNDEKCTKFAKKSIEKFLGEDKIMSCGKIMGSEDMSEYLEHIPGTLMLLGGRNEAKNCCYSHHSNNFNVDEDALPIGVACYAQIAVDYLCK
ncbi:M20 metallopeptidase family protein [Clostridium scatologenes]|uniref:Amidohydrolase n=1 Tax=Clostridium scatologenes TaxID=1548 RepID=A0A0E3M716_CLOSL|nr:amidohydrolase [Clostridium scatologenes]AKA68282.1 amidohydrolase [Clostridium scatologenes]